MLGPRKVHTKISTTNPKNLPKITKNIKILSPTKKREKICNFRQQKKKFTPNTPYWINLKLLNSNLRNINFIYAHFQSTAIASICDNFQFNKFFSSKKFFSSLSVLFFCCCCLARTHVYLPRDLRSTCTWLICKYKQSHRALKFFFTFFCFAFSSFLLYFNSLCSTGNSSMRTF